MIGFGLSVLGIGVLSALIRLERDPSVMLATALVVSSLTFSTIAWYRRRRKLAARKYREQCQLSHLQMLSWSELELHVAGFYRRQGYQITMTPRSGDHGVDVIADGKGRRIAIQVKQYSGSVDNTPVQEVVGGLAVYGCTAGVVITMSRFTNGAKVLAAANRIELIDGEAYVRLVLHSLDTGIDSTTGEGRLAQAG